jgi:hypothetical protein
VSHFNKNALNLSLPSSAAPPNLECGDILTGAQATLRWLDALLSDWNRVFCGSI